MHLDKRLKALFKKVFRLLENVSPEERIRAEVEEETGYWIQHVEKVFEAFMSPV